MDSALRRECLDRLLFWTAIDLETKLIAFKDYYNGHRSHSGLKGKRRSKHLNRRVRVFDRTGGDNIVVGSIKHRWRREEEFAIDRPNGFAEM